MDNRIYKKISNSKAVTLLKAVYLFFPGIIFLVIYYFIIVKLDIGQDMLMQAYENPGPFICTIICILIWMLFSWFSSRLISDEYVQRYGTPYGIIFEQFPRILGYNVAVCLQIAILNLPIIQMNWWALSLIYIFHIAFYVILHFYFTIEDNPPKKRKLFVIGFCLALAYMTLVSIGFFSKLNSVNNSTNFSIPGSRRALILILIFFIFQIVFTWLVIWRRQWLNRQRNVEDLGVFKKHSNQWRRSYDFFSIAVVVLYFFIVISQRFANVVGAIGITLIAFGLWVGFICLLKYFSLKFNLHFWLPLIILAVVYGVFSNPYKVRLLSTREKELYSHRLSIDSFFYKWVNDSERASQIRNSNTFNVYLVMSDGGASKSGFWVADVLSKLEDSSNADNRFSSHLFSLAGASGGSVGNAAFYCLLKAQIDSGKLNDSMEIESRKFFNGDFLSSSFARFLGPDLFRHFFPFIPMEDRATMLERSMETNSDSKVIGNYFSQSIGNVFDSTGRLPALFINTTNLQSGAPGVVSSVLLDSQMTERMDILTLIDTVKLNDSKDTFHDIRLSTGVVLGSRFPYISPAGAIGKKYFVDGGYFDNSGAGITLELLQYIERRMNDSNDVLYRPYKSTLAFKVIYISNGSDKAKEHGLNPLVNDLAAPMLTVLGTYGMQTNLTNKKLEAFLNHTTLRTTYKPFDTLNLPMNPKYDQIPYPLNWVISKYNLNRIDSNLKYVHPDSIFKR